MNRNAALAILATFSLAALPLVNQDAGQIDAAKLKEMITNLGYETKTLNEEVGKEKYEFTVNNDAFDIPIAA